jgi:ligand-binding SRPBCC domain-containing protein
MAIHFIGNRLNNSRSLLSHSAAFCCYGLQWAMQQVRYEVVIPAPIESVWKFHESARDALPLLAPPGSDIRLERIDEPQRVGAKVVISARGPLGIRMKWVAVYEKFEPVHRAADGTLRAEFVDIQESGPFKYWRHSHAMTAIDDHSTRLIDTINYVVPLGFLGLIANSVMVKRQLDDMFKHRHQATLKALL